MRWPWFRGEVAAICVIVLLARGVPVWAAHPLRIQPSDDASYADLYRLASRGLAPLWAASLRPLTRLEMARMVAGALDQLAADRTAFDSTSLNSLERLVLEFADELVLLGYSVVEPAQEPSALTITGWGVRIDRAVEWRGESGQSTWYEPATGSVLRIDLDATAGFGPKFVAALEIKSPLAPLSAATAINHAYFSMSSPDQRWVSQVGRDVPWWGPGSRGAFLLSDNAGALGSVRLLASWDRLRFVKLLTPISLSDGRYLYGMRLDWLATDTLRLGVSEAVVASGGVYLPYAVTPLPFLSGGLEVWYRDRAGFTDDYNIAFDFDWRVGRGTIFYGELYATRLWTVGTLFPTPGGATVGLVFGAPFRDSKTTIRLEHTRATNWIYTTQDRVNDYVLDGRALGHWCAPDCELLSASLAYDLGRDSMVELRYELVQKGEGQLGQTWSSPTDAWSRLYLSGVVETTQALRLRYQWMVPHRSRQEVGVTWSSVTNGAHVAGQAWRNWFFWWEAHHDW